MVIGIISAALGVVTIPMFSLFILQEAVQAASFGLFTLVTGKQWERALEHIVIYRSIIDKRD